MNYLCLALIYLLIIQLIFKLYLKDNISFNISKLLGNNINIRVEFSLNKIIKLNKQMSIIWIWFAFFNNNIICIRHRGLYSSLLLC